MPDQPSVSSLRISELKAYEWQFLVYFFLSRFWMLVNFWIFSMQDKGLTVPFIIDIYS
ncbi:MAG: hypothetical protein ACE5OZ_25700 [Candidatus Heimdallarchaeota archaeon]